MLEHVVIRSPKRINGRLGAKRPKTQQVLDFLGLAPKRARHFTVIAHCLGYCTQHDVENMRFICAHLRKHGRLVRTTPGVYQLPSAACTHSIVP